MIPYFSQRTEALTLPVPSAFFAHERKPYAETTLTKSKQAKHDQVIYSLAEDYDNRYPLLVITPANREQGIPVLLNLHLFLEEPRQVRAGIKSKPWDIVRPWVTSLGFNKQREIQNFILAGDPTLYDMTKTYDALHPLPEVQFMRLAFQYAHRQKLPSLVTQACIFMDDTTKEEEEDMMMMLSSSSPVILTYPQFEACIQFTFVQKRERDLFEHSCSFLEFFREVANKCKEDPAYVDDDANLQAAYSYAQGQCMEEFGTFPENICQALCTSSLAAVARAMKDGVRHFRS